MARRRVRATVSDDLAGRLAVDSEPGFDWRAFGARCARVGGPPASGTASRGRHVVNRRIALHPAVPLGSRDISYRTVDGMVGCGPDHLAVLDGNAARGDRARRLDNRLGALRAPHGQEHDRRAVPLTVHAARCDIAALLPAWCTLDRVSDSARLVCDRVDDLHVHAAADTE